MIPLLFAAAVALSGPIQKPFDAPTTWVLKDLPSAPAGSFVKPGPALQFKFQLGNGSLQAQSCDRRAIQTSGPVDHKIQKLGELPPGLEEHAVLRTINGCPVREIVSAGQTYYLDAPTGGLERVPASEVKQR